jgi:hypothetical protein
MKMNRLAQPKIYMIGCLFWTGMFLTACNNDSGTVVVPDSDSTPPIVSMTIFFETSDGHRQSLELTSDSESVSFEVNPTQPVSTLASGRDPNGGVRGVIVRGHIRVICGGDELANDISIDPPLQDSGGPGDTVPVHRTTSFAFLPMDYCPDGNANFEGSFVTYAENYHNMPAQTASFSFHTP